MRLEQERTPDGFGEQHPIPGGDLAADPDAVESMTNRGRTWISCHECGQSVAAVIEMGEDGYEVRACRDCLLAALELLPEPREVMP